MNLNEYQQTPVFTSPTRAGACRRLQAPGATVPNGQAVPNPPPGGRDYDLE